ncbi:3076_t:CDS:2 [Diversispora eburnea]|uniref:3076_t:CDS:1 n=1 Tax=Diversispora eburnea TaxID=1213867 RepID=A0A9N9FV57_9GLOM|nr:3076_t:CDS:2 [Diversispora eburnea]
MNLDELKQKQLLMVGGEEVGEEVSGEEIGDDVGEEEVGDDGDGGCGYDI